MLSNAVTESYFEPRRLLVGWEETNFWGVVPFGGSLENWHTMSLCFDSGCLHCKEDLAAKWIHSPRPKQETGERTQGKHV